MALKRDFRIKLFGDWKQVDRIMKKARFKMKRCIRTALLQEGHWYRKQVVRGIRKQAPGGKKFKPLAQTTLATRKLGNFRGRKALIRAGDLIKSITVQNKADGVFIGVLKTKRVRGRSMVNVARIHEFGSRPIVIKVTPAMRRFLFAAFKSRKTTRSGGSGVKGSGVIITRVPARPFLFPVFNKFRSTTAQRVQQRWAKCYGPEFGVLGKPPD